MFRNLVWLSAMAAAFVLLVYLFVLDTWVIPEGDAVTAAALQPTLSPGDRIVTRRGARPRRGALVRCRRPDDATAYVVGRLFGLEANRGRWVDIASDGIPRHYAGTGYVVAEMLARRGDEAASAAAMATVRRILTILGVS